MKWTPFVGPRTVGIKVESRLLLPFILLFERPLSRFLLLFLLYCGYVGNAFALSKRSGIFTDFNCYIKRRDNRVCKEDRSSLPPRTDASIVLSTATYSWRFILSNSGRIVTPGSHQPAFTHRT